MSFVSTIVRDVLHFFASKINIFLDKIQVKYVQTSADVKTLFEAAKLNVLGKLLYDSLENVTGHTRLYTRMYPKVSGVAACSDSRKWYSSG